MPKIKITEIDNTGTTQSDSISNNVYVPCKANGETHINPTLVSTTTQLATLDLDTSDLSYRLIRRCLELGLYCIVEGFTSEEFITDEVYTTEYPNIDWAKLESKTLYDIRFLTTGAYACPTKEMIEVASKRGDCIALLDHPLEVPDYEDGEEEHSQVEKVRHFFENLNDTTHALTYYFENNELSYASCFTPWWYTTNDTLCGENDTATIPASFGYLFAYARSIVNYPSWYAIAGSYRGVISELSGVVYDYTESEVEILQARGVSEEVDLGDSDSLTSPYSDYDNVGQAINSIAYQGSSFGYLIWGNRTFRENDEENRTIATSFLNVRQLLCEFKKTLWKVCKKYTFEPNSDTLWANFQAGLTPTLNKMQSGNGILGYKIQRQSTSAKARLRAKIILIPVEAVEDFELTIELDNESELEVEE